MRSIFCLLVVVFVAAAPANAQVTPFNIEVIFTDDAADFQSAFDAAESTWESLITGWADGRNITAVSGGNPDYNVGDDVDTLFITAGTFDGAPGGVLGSAGPTAFADDGSIVLATRGAMNFDTFDLQNLADAGSLEDVILHEMAHVIGIGTVWDVGGNGLYVDGTGQYTGANALREYQREFNNDATFVPVELGGGGGTANGHWDEGRVASAGDTILDPDGLTVIDPTNVNFGQSRTAVLMTGFLDSGANTFISATTLGSYQDLGYTVDFSTIRAVPEPSSAVAVMVLGIAGLGRRRRS